MIDSDHQSSMVNKLRSLVGSVQRCIDIDWKSEYFREDIDQTIPDLPELQDATSSLAPSAYFSQSMAVYSYRGHHQMTRLFHVEHLYIAPHPCYPTK